MAVIKIKPAINIDGYNNEIQPDQIQEDDISKFIKKDYKIACILDEFSYKCFRYESKFFQLEPENWEEALVQEKPHFVLVESAWKGKDLKWRNKVGGLHISKDETLKYLVNWCREHHIPTVFWNKEDPSNFQHFIEAAKLFDYVFTTDYNSIVRYRELLGHDRVYVLPFAAQPRMHNPIDKNKEKIGEVAFAGTWYNQKHENRRKELQILLTPALEYDLHIYDRMFEYHHKYYLFPDIYQPYIKGFLAYDDMIHTYKKYQVFLNVNSVSDSPTMFSRRVFELLACGSSVISSYSRGIEELLTGLVKMCRSETDTRQHLQELLNDEEYRDRLALRAQREVLSKHTYKHRLENMLENIGIESEKDVGSGVSVISICRHAEMIDQIIDNFLRQNYSIKELIIVINNGEFNKKSWQDKIQGYQNIVILQLKQSISSEAELKLALTTAKFPYVSFFNAYDYYAPNFLLDLLFAFDYADADAVGKCTYYSGCGDTLIINNAKLENQYVNFLLGSAMVLKKEVFDSEDCQCLVTFEHGDFSLPKIKLYATDRFNYVCKSPKLSEADIELISV